MKNGLSLPKMGDRCREVTLEHLRAAGLCVDGSRLVEVEWGSFGGSLLVRAARTQWEWTALEVDRRDIYREVMRRNRAARMEEKKPDA